MQTIYEHIEPDQGSSFRASYYEWYSLQDHLGWHTHSHYEITLITRGSATLYVGDSITQLYTGRLVLMGPDLPSTMSEEPHPDESYAGIVVQFSHDFIRRTLGDTPEGGGVLKLLDRARRGLIFDIADKAEIAGNIETITKTSGLERMLSLFHVLDLLVGRHSLPLASEYFLANSEKLDEGRMAQIVDYVKRNMASEIVQRHIASELGMSPAGFSRYFRNVTGRTFMSYVNIVRTSAVCHLLATTDDDITHIAYECGYTNISNFNRHFRQIRGVSPSQYRKMRERGLRRDL